ncbi:CDGSH iron-sulfur domain-containing protein [Patescibacteria group bacterium]
MARKVIKTAHKPHKIEPNESSVFICMCGLSKNQPFCDGSHHKTKDEDDEKLYIYDEKGNKSEVCDCECPKECCKDNK